MDLNDVRVFSQQAGGRKAGTTTVFGNRITFNPAQDFKPGEVVFVTPLPALASNSRAKRFVYQFTTRAGVGPATFSDSEVRVDGQPDFVVTTDVNNDGNLDFLTANRINGFRGNVSLRLGNGQGAFSGTTTLPIGNAPRDLVAADVNGDGNMDFLVLSSDSEAVNVRLGNGRGGFTTVPDVRVGSRPQRLAVADVNGDGNLDLLVTEFGNDNPSTNGLVRVRLGNGQGGFSGTTNVTVSYGTRYIAVADVNGDRYLDFLTGTSVGGSTSTVSVRLGDGLGNFSGTTDIAMPVGTNLYGLVTADVNNDGNLDFLASNISSGSNGPNAVTTHLGNGQGGFSLASSLPVSGGSPSGSPFDIQVADVNGDGNLDFVTANFSVEGTASVRLGNGQGSFSGTLTLPAGFRPTDLTVGDIDGDGDLDLLVASFGTNSVVVLRNQPLPSITSFSPTGGPVGTSVVLTGDNFTGATAVTFNGTVATSFVVNSPTQITVTVPTGATTGPIAVTTPAATATSSTNFQVTQAPVVTTTTGITTALEQVTTVVDAGVTVTDTDSPMLTSATVRISSGLAVFEDVLWYTFIRGFNGTYSTGVLTITGNGTPAQWQAVLRSVTYTNRSANPTTTPRTISFEVSDGTLSSAPATKVVQIQAVNGAPAIPVDADPAANIVAERAAPGTPVGITVSATDADGPTLTYSLTNDAGGRFTINPTTGVVTVANGALLNYAAATSHLVTAQASDGTLASSQSFTIQITPVSCAAPVLTPPADQTVVAASGQCSASVAFAATATGSPAPTLRYTIGTTPITSPYTFPVGTTSVTVTATNTCGTTMESFTVTVEDRQAPTLRAAGFITAIESNGLRTIEAADVDWGSFDTCSGIASMRISPRTFTCANIGPNQVTLTVTDNAGNSASETVTVILVDNSAPVIVAAGFETTLINGTRTIEASDIDYGSYDACGSIASMSISPRTFTCANVGPNPVTLTVTDNSGNVSSQTVTVVVQADATCSNSVASRNNNGPTGASLSNDNQLQAYPNPVTDHATVSFRPTQAGKAQVKVYNQLGVLVATLYDGQVEASRLYKVTFNGQPLANGVYNCQFITNGNVTNQRLLISK